ncbi:hypothetical protein RE6C_00427 [Rhodopirellula europaea 6C]|uniref:Uncharacterized protein n=1 Tax=Rhodopirellula europaea 6C TaxID=1263867 RepID=M2B1V8_9BACT|nr:hypothetical protein RE6C_00427 [Rhodopirellula europaea 6C]
MTRAQQKTTILQALLRLAPLTVPLVRFRERRKLVSSLYCNVNTDGA